MFVYTTNKLWNLWDNGNYDGFVKIISIHMELPD
jgi:hypothetical protein